MAFMTTGVLAACAGTLAGTEATPSKHVPELGHVQRIVEGAKAETPRTVFDIKTLMAAGPLAERVEPLVDSLKFSEGPAWSPEGFLVFSDIPNDTLHTWSPTEGLGVFRQPSHKANGNVFAPNGDLITCEHDARRVTRTSPDGAYVVLADSFEGRAFHSPNDAAIAPDGAVWFTDPGYGLAGRKPEIDGHHVWRIDPDSGVVKRMADGFDQPNGIAFSPDGGRLYVADSGKPRHVRVFDVINGGLALGAPRVFAEISPGVPDGLCVHPNGDLYVAAGNGVQVFSAEGVFIALVPTPLAASNVCLGGDNGDTLFITARNALFRLRMPRAPRESGALE